MDTNEVVRRYAAGERNFEKQYLCRGDYSLKNESLVGINLKKSIIHGMSLEGAILKNSNFHEVTFEYVNLKKSDLSESDLSESEFKEGNILEGVNFERANLAHAQLKDTNLQAANLKGAILTAANLRRANLRGADLRGAKLNEANFQEANLEGVRSDEETKWASALNLSSATFSDESAKQKILLAQSSQLNINVEATETLVINGHKTNLTFEKAKEHIKKLISQRHNRRGQAKFRRDLLKAYKGRCAITACNISEALEAAHVVPYCLTGDNDISNGILLRADLHTLFDCNLIRINPDTHSIELDGYLMVSHDYSYLPKFRPFLEAPKGAIDSKWRNALRWRFNEYYKYLS